MCKCVCVVSVRGDGDDDDDDDDDDDGRRLLLRPSMERRWMLCAVICWLWSGSVRGIGMGVEEMEEAEKEAEEVEWRCKLVRRLHGYTVPLTHRSPVAKPHASSPPSGYCQISGSRSGYYQMSGSRSECSQSKCSVYRATRQTETRVKQSSRPVPMTNRVKVQLSVTGILSRLLAIIQTPAQFSWWTE